MEEKRDGRRREIGGEGILKEKVYWRRRYIGVEQRLKEKGD